MKKTDCETPGGHVKFNSRHLHTITIMFIGLGVLTQYNNCSRIAVDDLKAMELGTQGTGTTLPPTTLYPLVNQTTQAMLKAENKKVDIILVIDDSGSMENDSAHLASKLSGFVQNLDTSQLDWQMCLTTTAAAKFDGDSLPWSGVSSATNWIVNKDTSNLSNVFTTTVSNITFGGSNTGDERGIKSLNRHLAKKSQNGCYRPGAALSSIVISDEDERSVGGDPALSSNSQYAPLETLDLPETYTAAVQSSLSIAGAPVALTSHSIIIKPGDSACHTAQGNGHYGKIYERLSTMTNGKVGSICAADFTSTLDQFAEQIVKSTHAVQLLCPPYNSAVQISVMPALPVGTSLQYHLENSLLIVDSPITQDLNISVSYQCSGN